MYEIAWVTCDVDVLNDSSDHPSEEIGKGGQVIELQEVSQDDI